MKKEIEHPAFPQPIDLKVSLWRYLDFVKFEWFVDNNRLFFPVTKYLGNDYLEGTQPVGDQNWWQELQENAETDEKRQIIKNNRKLISKFSNGFLRHYYVNCWHMNSIENMRMWESYTKDSNSVVIRTSYNVLKESIPDYLNIGMVRYIDYSSERLPSLNLFQYITHKHISFQFENEVRAVAFPPAGDQNNVNHFQDSLFEKKGSPGFKFFAPLVDINKIILDTFLHPKSERKFRDTIIYICAKNGLTKPKISMFWN